MKNLTTLRQSMNALAVATMTLLGSYSSVFADDLDRSVNIYNSSDYIINAVYISHLDASSWGRDLLRNDILDTDSEYYVSPRNHQGYCRFDVLIEISDIEGNWTDEEVLQDVNLCEAYEIYIDEDGFMEPFFI